MFLALIKVKIEIKNGLNYQSTLSRGWKEKIEIKKRMHF